MMITHFQYYCQLSTTCQIRGYSQSITNQAAICELITVWPEYSNLTVHIISDSQRLINQATLRELNTLWLRDSEPRSYCRELVSWIQYGPEILIPDPIIFNCHITSEFLSLTMDLKKTKTLLQFYEIMHLKYILHSSKLYNNYIIINL